MPACSEAEFAALAAWLVAHGGSLPTVNGWKRDLDLGDGATVILSRLTCRVARGATADGGGKLAETIRRPEAWHEGVPTPPERWAGGRASTTPGWVPSVVRDDEGPSATVKPLPWSAVLTPTPKSEDLGFVPAIAESSL